jgi:hypothetical protein
VPVDSSDAMHERLHSGRGICMARGVLGHGLEEEGPAFIEAMEEAAGDFGVLPEQFQNVNGFSTHLEDASIGVAAAEESEEGAQFDLGAVSCVALGTSRQGAAYGEYGVGGYDRAFEHLPEFAETPAIVREHSIGGDRKKLRDELDDLFGEAAGDGDGLGFREMGAEAFSLESA